MEGQQCHTEGGGSGGGEEGGEEGEAFGEVGAGVQAAFDAEGDGVGEGGGGGEGAGEIDGAVAEWEVVVVDGVVVGEVDVPEAVPEGVDPIGGGDAAGDGGMADVEADGGVGGVDLVEEPEEAFGGAFAPSFGGA